MVWISVLIQLLGIFFGYIHVWFNNPIIIVDIVIIIVKAFKFGIASWHHYEEWIFFLDHDCELFCSHISIYGIWKWYFVDWDLELFNYDVIIKDNFFSLDCFCRCFFNPMFLLMEFENDIWSIGITSRHYYEE